MPIIGGKIEGARVGEKKMETYWDIDKDILKTAHKDAWSIENMAAHGAEDRPVVYVGSAKNGNVLIDYYEDNTGHYWFRNRGIRHGKIVSMDVYIFGHEIKRKNRKRKS